MKNNGWKRFAIQCGGLAIIVTACFSIFGMLFWGDSRLAPWGTMSLPTAILFIVVGGVFCALGKERDGD